MTDIVERLRAPRITHHKISEDWEPYKTAAKTHPAEEIRIEASDEIERLRARLEWNPEYPEQDGIYCRDETIRLQDAEIEKLRAEVEDWRTKLSAVMPADYKDWHQNSPAERPEIAAMTITNLRQRRDEAEDEAGRLLSEVEALRPDAAIGRLVRGKLCDNWKFINKECRIRSSEVIKVVIEQAPQAMSDEAQADGEHK